MKKQENSSIWQKICNFSNKLPCLSFSMIIAVKSSKKWLVSWKSTKNHWFGQNFPTFRKTTMSFHFYQFLRKKLQKLPHFVKKHENSLIWPKLCNFFEQTTMFWCFDELFSKRSQKVAQFVEKHKKTSIFSKLWNFEETTMSFHFDELFRKKLQKVPHSVEKHENSSIWPKLCNFFEQTTMSLHFDQLFGKKLQKVPHFVKQHEKSLIWPKLCNFWNKLQCLFPFDELSRKKLQKVLRLVKKHEKSSTYSTCKFPRKLPCFDVSMNIAAKSCRKLLVEKSSTNLSTFRTNFDVFAFRWVAISWKSTKNRNFATFRATMF